MSKFYDGLAEILELEKGLLSPDLELSKFNWDSISIVSTLVLMDECCGINPDGSELAVCKTVGDLEDVIKRGSQ